MHGSLPLARLINGVSQPSPSRIPHLTFHILHRLSPSSAHRTSKLCLSSAQNLRQIKRLSSSSATLSTIWEPFRQPPALGEHDGFSSVREEADQESASDSTYGAKSLVTMQELLEENNPDRILLGLVTPQIGYEFVKTADDTAFARAICALDPDHFVVPYRDMFRYMKPSLETQPKHRVVKSLEERVASFINILDTLVTQRQEHGHALGLDIYRHLLRCTAAAGIGSFARNVFRNFMPAEEIVPDLDCYNYLMEALTWNDAYSRHERYRLRIVTHNMLRRSGETRPLGFRGHGVASPLNPKNQESIRLEILSIFNELVNQGLNGNEATFCNLMVAMGREGDLGSVKSVLKSVWNIDVEALDKFDEEELESPTFYEEGSPLRPSARLLTTVVHVFCTNNEVALGGMLLDYISRNYNVAIPGYTWTLLLEWTYVLSIQNRNSRVDRGFGEGRIARRAVESVYHVFHNEPYNVKPKIVDLMFRFKGRAVAKRLFPALYDLRECMALLEQERTRLSEMYDQLRRSINDEAYHLIFSDGLPSAEFLDLKRRYILTSLQVDCHIQLISIGVRNTFKKKSWTSTDEGTDWPYRGIPDMITEWRDWLPNILSYYTPTGHVRLWGRDFRHAAIQSANSMQTTRAGAMRLLLDTYSPIRLRHATEFIHHRGPWHAIFQAEVDNDTSGRLSDWVMQYESALRQERLTDQQVATSVVEMPGPDHLSETWSPWGGMFDQKAAPKPSQERWEMKEDGSTAEDEVHGKDE